MSVSIYIKISLSLLFHLNKVLVLGRIKQSIAELSGWWHVTLCWVSLSKVLVPRSSLSCEQVSSLNQTCFDLTPPCPSNSRTSPQKYFNSPQSLQPLDSSFFLPPSSMTALFSYAKPPTRVTVELLITSEGTPSTGPKTRTLVIPKQGTVLIGRASTSPVKDRRPTAENALFTCPVMSRSHATISAPYGLDVCSYLIPIHPSLSN